VARIRVEVVNSMGHSETMPSPDNSGARSDNPTIPDTPSTEELTALRAIVEGTTRHTGQEFFQSLVRHLAAAVGTHGAFVAQFAGDMRARTLAFWFQDRIGENFEWDVTGTPCEDVVRGNLCHYPSGVRQHFPRDKRSADLGTESYLGVPLVDAQGKHLGHLAVFDDRAMPAEPRKLFIFHIFATRAAAELERLHYEARLRESEQRWKSLTEELRHVNTRLDLAVRGSHVGVWDLDLPGSDYNRRLRHYLNVWEQLGYDGPPNGRASALEEAHPDDRAHFDEEARRYLACEIPEFETEIRLRHKDGYYRTMLARGAAVRDAAGKPLRFVGIIIDITKLKRVEEALRHSEERYRVLTQSIPQKIFTATANGDVDYFNQQWMEFTGLSFDQIKDWGWLQFIHPDDVEENVRRWQHSVDTGEPFQLEHRFRGADGVYRWHLSRALAMRDFAGRVLMWFGANTDIDDQKRAAEAFKQAKEAAEAANRAKDEFLANVSHEIRTPMNAILGMTELALDTPLTEDQRQYLTTVKSAADALLGIINDILDFAKIEAGRLELDPADFLLRAAVGDTLRALAVRAHKKGLELIYQVRPEVPDALIGDAGRLRQILLNLVGNAIKFTEHGEVVVSVSKQTTEDPEYTEKRHREKEDKESGVPLADEARDSISSSSVYSGSSVVCLRFEVSDTGIGIPPEKQARIFQAFEQEDTSTTRKYGGTGLGLTIAARLVALMGGEIRVDSAPGQGSTFAFTACFGLQPHPPETIAASPPALLRGLPVLVVDDNATNRHILVEWLRAWQMQPMAVGDGVMAMAALWRGVAQIRPYPLVLLDGRMPDIDGLDLAAKIRQQMELSATRLILLTSGDRPGDLTRARQLGISARLLKPLQPRELMETILRIMGHQGDPEGLLVGPTLERPPIPEGLVGASLRILAAEDNEFNRDLLEHMLARLGLSATMAVNGREALALLGIRDQRAEGRSQKSEVSEDRALSPLTSDLRPLTTGFDLLLLDIHMPELDGFQVVGAIRERERTAGGHLPVIALTARSRKEDRERCLQAGMDECVTKPFTAANLWVAMSRILKTHPARKPLPLDLIDPPVLLAACGSDPTMLRKMCRSLQARVPEHLAAIRDSLHDHNASRLREAAHKFYGMLAAFSTVAGDQAASLEDLAARGLLNDALPVVEQLGKCATELARLAGGLTIETLQKHAETAHDADRSASL
jgi:two-component system, sensor histidine kinase and response regulator